MYVCVREIHTDVDRKQRGEGPWKQTRRMKNGTETEII